MTTHTKPNRNMDAFRQAILESLERLIQSGEKISASTVVASAKYSNGRLVGKSTLYRKNIKSQEYVHVELLRKIKKAADNSLKNRVAKSTRTDTFSYLQSKITELNLERKQLLDAVAGQEARLLAAEGDMGSDRHELEVQETEIYVLASVASELASGAISDFSKLVLRFEKKYRNQGRKIELAKCEIDRYINEVRSHKLIGLADIKKRPRGISP